MFPPSQSMVPQILGGDSDPRRIAPSPQALSSLAAAQQPSGIYNAQLKPQDPWWKSTLKGFMGDLGMGPTPLGMAAISPEAEAALGGVQERIANTYHLLDKGTGGNKTSVTFLRLRQALPDIPKEQFDRAVLGMTNGPKSPFLKMWHDSAGGHSPDFLDKLVFDPNFDPQSDPMRYMNPATAPKGRYYVSMVSR